MTDVSHNNISHCTSCVILFHNESAAIFLWVPSFPQVFVGGVIQSNMPNHPKKANFRGCLENVFYNGINIIDLAEYGDSQIRFHPGQV